ncbi:MAG: Na(+)-translocating NADH-quinone reductase subunit A [Gammaproteobacteria bacterium]|nr:Na(+)-translocating NADH-quinone reductase subunit A [Gammaproteobacteria bacterium]
MNRIKRGMQLPISGAPEQIIGSAQAPRSVALVGSDYVGMKPTMLVAEGDRVKLGQPLFSDKKNPDVVYTSPGCGVVSAINRGYQRRLLSVVVELDGDEQVELAAYEPAALRSLTREQIVQDLVTSGLWTSLRVRPFSKVPEPAVQPLALFINGMDTNPLAANPAVVLADRMDDFARGVNLLSRLPKSGTFLCVDGAVKSLLSNCQLDSSVRVEEFSGPHPAGLSGTHIHTLAPAGLARQIAYINYQDVAAIGKLFATGVLEASRVISLAGPQVTAPRLVRSRLGASLDELCAGELMGNDNRLITGSVLGGRKADGVEAFLGRYHLQVSVLREGRDRPLFGYLSPGRDRHSVMGIYLSSFFKGEPLPLSTSAQGSDRAMVPIGAYEKIMPLDILPTQLLRALIVGDIESAINLGALELDEEDLALCSYVCPGKYEYGTLLRDNLARIEKEA